MVVKYICQKLKVSQRRACQVLGQPRATQRRHPSPPSDEKRLTEDIITLANKYGRYGYRRITALLNNQMGWRVNHKRVERVWRREGLEVPKKQLRRGRLWLNDVSCIRLRPEHKDHVWSYDFMVERTSSWSDNASSYAGNSNLESGTITGGKSRVPGRIKRMAVARTGLLLKWRGDVNRTKHF